MPTYVYLNSETGEQEEHFHKISEMETFSANNPHLTRIITTSRNNLITGYNQKPDEGFRDILKSVKKASGRNSNINTF
jgi:hypothetical protein